MDSRRKPRPSADGQPIVVSAPTLKEAYRKVKSELGEDAVILSSRNVTLRQSQGLGSERTVEVIAQTGGAGRRPLAAPADGNGAKPAPGGGLPVDLPAGIGREVQRIEGLVREIARHHEDQERQGAVFMDNPLAEALLTAGAEPATVERLLTRFTSETGKAANDRVGAITWLTDHLRASNCQWDGFYGCHAFLGRAGCGRTGMIYQAAARLQERGRKTLVLSLMPGHTGEVRRLQAEASRLGFDAAVIQRDTQLVKSEAHLARYDAVLVDMPALDSPLMVPGGTLHGWLANNPSFHRHLVVGLDGDPRDMDDLSAAAKGWQADWMAVSRCDLGRRPGKFLEFSEMIPLPFSLLGHQAGGEARLDIAASGDILDRVLAQEPAAVTGRAAGAAI